MFTSLSIAASLNDAALLNDASDVRLDKTRRTSLSERRMTVKVILLSALF